MVLLPGAIAPLTVLKSREANEKRNALGGLALLFGAIFVVGQGGALDQVPGLIPLFAVPSLASALRGCRIDRHLRRPVLRRGALPVN